MNIITRPKHKCVPGNTGDRLPRRLHGASHSYVGGRERDISPSLLPVACVPDGNHARACA
jgi:hypothetical protein